MTRSGTGTTGPLPDVHLCGSIPLADVDEVFTTAASIVGMYATRIPDGELGPRSSWIAWQQQVLRDCPGLVEQSKRSGAYGTVRSSFALADGQAPGSLDLGPLGYAQAAKDSYARFADLQAAGAVREATRFLVGLPTPLSLTLHFIEEADRSALEPVFERHIRAELEEIAATLPHAKLAVQWEVVFEFAVLEGVRPSHLGSPAAEIGDRLAALGEWVPHEMELGYHLCYGDSGGHHFLEPKDSRWLADQAARIVRGARRRVDWLHVPVPIERDDSAYFAPLAGLELPAETRLYLGLVHREDGLDGARRRIRAASGLGVPFGIATECGLGREPSDAIRSLLELHVEIVEDAGSP